MLTWVLNTPLLFEDYSNILFPYSISHYKTPEICSMILFFKVLYYFNSSKMLLNIKLKEDFISM